MKDSETKFRVVEANRKGYATKFVVESFMKDSMTNLWVVENLHEGF